MKYLISLLLLISTLVGQSPYWYSTLDDFEYELTANYDSAIEIMNDSIFILLYKASTGQAVLKSFEVDSDFKNITMLDSISTGLVNTGIAIQKIDANKILSVHNNSVNTRLETFSFNADWEFTQIDSIQRSNLRGGLYQLLSPSEDYFVLTSGYTNSATLSTWSVDGDGDNITYIDQASVLTGGGDAHQLSVSQINDTTFVTSNRDDGYDPTINTITTDTNYDNVASIEYWTTPSTMANPDQALIDGTHLLTRFGDPNSPWANSYWRIYSWDGNYENITGGTYETESGAGATNATGKIIQWGASENYLMFQQFKTEPSVRSVTVNGSYVISDNADEYVFTTNTQHASYVEVKAEAFNDSTYIVTYIDEDTDGWVAIVAATLVEPSSGWGQTINGIIPTEVNGIIPTAVNGI